MSMLRRDCGDYSNLFQFFLHVNVHYFIINEKLCLVMGFVGLLTVGG